MPGKFPDPGAIHRAFLSTALVYASVAMPSMSASLDTTSPGRNERSAVNSDQMLELGTSDSSALRLEGEQSMRLNNIDRAIIVLQKSVQLAPADMDGRVLYAEALEKKLLKQKDRDPSLYNFVVKQWLYISKKADFMDQANQGAKHLASLTGQKPRKWEPSSRYLARVLMPENKSAQVAFHGKPGDKTQ